MIPGKRLKICFVYLGIYPLFNRNIENTIGGAEYQLYLLTRELARDDNFEISFIVGDYGQKDLEIFYGIKLYKSIKTSPKGSKSTLFSIFKKFFLLAKVMRKVDAEIYIRRAAGADAGIIRMVTSIFRKKFLYMSASEWDCNGNFEKQAGWFKGFLFKYGIRNADLIVTQTEFHKELLKKHHYKDSIVLKSITNIPDNYEYQKKAKISVLWVGRSEDLKQPELFLKLACNFPSEKFVMISPRSTHYPEYFQKIKQMALSQDNLELIDFVPFDKIDKYFEEAIIFVNTSRWEGFPNTFLQAAKYKTPILSLSVNPDNFLERYNCGKCSFGNFDRFINDFSRIISDSRTLSFFGENAYKYVKQNHDINQITQQYKKIFFDLDMC